MGWDNILGGDDGGSPVHTSADATLRFDQMLMADSFLLDEHSYDNYLDALDGEDLSFAVPPFASSTPTAQKTNVRQLEAPKSRLDQLRGGVKSVLGPPTAHTPRALSVNAGTEDITPRKGTPNFPAVEERKGTTKGIIDVPGVSDAGLGKENLCAPQPNALPPSRPEVKPQPINKPTGSSHIPHLQATLNPTRNPLIGIPRPRPNSQVLSAIGTTHSRTNSTSSAIPGPSTTARAATQPSLSSRLAEAFSAFDSIIESAKPTTVAIVKESAMAVRVPYNSHPNVATNEARSIISTGSEVRADPPAGSTSTPPRSPNSVDTDAEIHTPKPTRNIRDEERRASLFLRDGGLHADTDVEGDDLSHLDPPVQNGDKILTELSTRHSNAYPQHSRSPTPEDPPSNIAEHEAQLSAATFPTPKEKETAVFPDTPISPNLSPPLLSSPFDTRASFGSTSQPPIPDDSLSGSNLPIPLPKAAQSQGEVTGMGTNTNDPDEIFAQQLEETRQSLLRHRLSEAIINPSLLSEALSRNSLDQFVAPEPERIKATELPSALATSFLSESIIDAPPEEVKPAIVSITGASDSLRVKDKERLDKGMGKEKKQNLSKEANAPKKSSSSLSIGRKGKTALEVPDWVHPVPPRTSMTSAPVPSSTSDSVPATVHESKPIASPASDVKLESDPAAKGTKVTLKPSHVRVASSSLSSSALPHSKCSESTTNMAVNAPKGTILERHKPVARAQSTTSISKPSVPSSTISSHSRERTVSKPTAPPPPKSTVTSQRTATTTSGPKSAIVSSVHPKLESMMDHGPTPASRELVDDSTTPNLNSAVSARIHPPVTKQVTKEMVANDKLLSATDQRIREPADYVNPRTTEGSSQSMGKAAAPQISQSPFATASEIPTSKVPDPVTIESSPTFPAVEQGPHQNPIPRGSSRDNVHNILDTTATQIVDNLHSTSHTDVTKLSEDYLAPPDIKRSPLASHLQSDAGDSGQPSNGPQLQQAPPHTDSNTIMSSTSHVSRKARPPATLAPKTTTVAKEPRSAKPVSAKPTRPAKDNSNESTKQKEPVNGAVPVASEEGSALGTAHLATDVAKRAKEQQKRTRGPRAKVDEGSSGKHRVKTASKGPGRQQITPVLANPAPALAPNSRSTLGSGSRPGTSDMLDAGSAVHVSPTTITPAMKAQNVTDVDTMDIPRPSRGIYGDIPRGPLHILAPVQVDMRASDSNIMEASAAMFIAPSVVPAKRPEAHHIELPIAPRLPAVTSEEPSTRNAHDVPDFGTVKPAPQRRAAEAPSRKGKERALPVEEELDPAPRSSGSEGSNSSGNSSKRLPIESPVRDRILQTKRTRVETQENAPPITGQSRSARRQSGASLASAIVIDDDSDGDNRDDHPMLSALALPKGKGKRKSIDFDERAVGNKRPRVQATDPRRVVSHTIVTSNGFASWGRPPKGPVHRPVAVPLSGALPGEASRQRALERERRARERKAQEEKEKEKRATEGNRPPENSRKVSDPASIIFGAKKTVPAPFTFESDARVEKYRAQFEARLAHWEVRTREAAQSNSHPSIPNFAARQAEHLTRIEAARQAAKAKVTEPKTPGLKTKVRVKERQAFDEHVREKDRIVFKLREIKRVEQEELERREIRELRKRLDQNVKANPVPEWYRVESEDDEIQILE